MNRIFPSEKVTQCNTSKRVVFVVLKKPPSIVYWLENNLYLNITNRCPNNCFFCFRKYKDGVGGFNLKLQGEPQTEEIITEIRQVINRKNWKELVFCGFGEPLERLDCILQVTRWIKTHHGTTVRINTNGQGFLLNKERDVIKELKQAGVDKLSVSFTAQDKSTYDYVCKPSFENAFESVLDFIQKAKSEIDTEITVVTIPEADISKVEELAEKIGVSVRTRQYIPCLW